MQAQAIEQFLTSGDSRETSPEVMEAIMDLASAYPNPDPVRIWEAPTESECVAIWEMVTKNGLLSDRDFHWGCSTLHEVIRS